MALSARELVLILRATNQASGPMRQVARDLRSLGSSGAVTGRTLDQVASARRWQRMGLAGAVLRDTGRSARIMGIVAGAGLIYAAKGAADFNTQVTLAATQTGKLDANLSRTTDTILRNSRVIESGILRQMQQFPATQEDMASAAYEIFSSTNLGLRNVSEGMKLLNLFNKAAVAGQTDLNEVTQTGISVMQGYGFTVKDMPRILNRAFAAVRFGRFTFAEFTQSLNTLVPAAIGANQSFDTVAGTMAFLTRRMPNVRMAGVALARMMEIFGRKKFVDGAKKFGVNVTDAVGRIRPLPVLLTEFRQAIDRLPLKERANMVRNLFKELSNTEGTIQARRALTHLLKDVDGYKNILALTIKDQNEFARSLAAMEQTTGVRWKVLTNQLRAFFLLIGAMALPVLMELMKPLQDLFNWFRKLDKETQNQIVRWVAIGAAIAILGGTIASVVGALIVMIAPFKAFGGSLTVILGLLGLVSAALLILTGHGNLVKDAFSNIMDAATASVQNFVIATAGLLIATRRIALAVAGMSMISGAGGVGGLLGGLAARGRAGREAFGVTRGRQEFFGGKFQPAKELGIASRSANALKAALAGSSLAALGLGAGLLPVVGIIVAAGAAALLWKRHQQGIREEAERTARFQAQVQGPVRAAGRTAAFGLNFRDLKSAQLAVKQVDLNIKSLRKSLKGATGDERAQLGLQLEQAYIDRAVALAHVDSAQRRAAASAGGVTVAIQKQVGNLGMIRDIQRRIAAERAIIADPNLYGASAVERARQKIVELQGQINQLYGAAQRAGQSIQTGIGQSLRDLRAARILEFPMRQFETIRNAIAQFSVEKGKLASVPEMRAIVRAVLDPKSVAALNPAIQRAIGIVKIRAEVQTRRGQVANLQRQVQQRFRETMGGRDTDVPQRVVQAQVKLRGASEALAEAEQTQAKLAAVFKKAIRQNVNVKVNPPDTSGLGRQIAAGVASGIRAGIPDVQAAAAELARAALPPMQSEIQARSPSLLFKNKIGIPIVQGVIAGILSKAGEAADAAVYTIEQIEGKSVAAMTKFLQKQRTSIAQMNNNLQTLVNRKVPLQLVYQLAQLGQEGAKQLAKLAGASKSELAKFVAAWRGANAQVNRSARFNWDRLVEFVDSASQKLLDLYNQARDQLQDFVFGSLNDFTELARRGADAVANAFGEIFQGPAGVAEGIGEAFAEAQRSYSESMNGLQEQMLDLQQQQADTIQDFMERRRDELRQAFGQLFSGPILSQGFMAGSIRDLQADLDRQFEVFRTWRNDLNTLAARGLPKRLIKDLEELGPDASHNLGLLANATDDELSKYVKTWELAQGAISDVAAATFMDMEGFAEAMDGIAEQMAEVARQMRELEAPKRTTFSTLLADLQAQKTAWTDYVTILDSLRAKGVPLLLLTQLAELGVEGVDILRILNTGTSTQLSEYIALWTGSQEAMKTAKKGWVDAISPEEILNGLQTQVDGLKDWEAAIDGLVAKNVPAQIIKQLRELGPDALPLLQGINNMTAPELAKFVTLWTGAQKAIDQDAKQWVNEQIALWKTHGSNIAQGIIAGVMDEQAGLLAFFRKLFLNLLNEAKRETKSRSPSQVYFELGRNIVQGFQMGLNSIQPELSTPGGPGINGAFSHRNGGGINMTVNAHHSETLQSTMERTAFRMRARRPR